MERTTVRVTLMAVSLASSMCLGLSIPAAESGTNDSAKIAVHVVAAPTGKAPQPCDRISPPPCNPGSQTLSVTGSVGHAYDVFLLVADGSPIAGVAGASFGISYNGDGGAGVDIFGWSLCGQLEFPGGPSGTSWPASGSGNVITWNGSSDCQDTSTPDDEDGGVTCILGVLSVYVYSDDVLAITPRLYTPLQDLQVVDCASSSSDIIFPEHAAKVQFGNGDGEFDPCASADTLAPGAVEISSANAESGPGNGYPVITWIAPADDGYRGVPASRYELRYSTYPISINNWLSAASVGEIPKPGTPGTEESVEVRELLEGCRYYVALRTYDRSGNESQMSNVIPIRIPDPLAAFSERIPRNGAELWAAGNPVQTDLVEISYDGLQLRVSGNVIEPYALFEGSTAEDQVKAMESLANAVPSIKTAIGKGRSIQAATREWRLSKVALIDQARSILTKEGSERAVNFLAESDLVGKVELSGTTAYVTFEGKAIAELYDLSEPAAGSSSASLMPKGEGDLGRELLENLRAHLSLPGANQLLVLVTTRGDICYLAGVSREKADSQIQFVLSGASLNSLPAGPFDPARPPLRDFVERAGGRKQ